MRVTANTFPNSLVDQLAQLTRRQSNLQQQVATGQKVRLPEDNPISVQKILDLQAETRLVNQYRKNIDRLKDTANATHEVLRSLNRVSDRAGEIGTLADGTKPPDQLRLYAVEVTSLIRQAVQVANTQFRGDYLLGGTLSDQPPYVINEDADGNVVSVTYQGNQTAPQSEIAEGSTLTANVIGSNNTGSGARGLLEDSRYGADFFNHLISLQDNLLAGDSAAVQATDLAALNQDEDNLLIHIGNSGATLSRLETNQANARSRSDSLEIMVSNEADADLSEVLVRLNQTEIAYQAALQTGARLLNTSLLDYLR